MDVFTFWTFSIPVLLCLIAIFTGIQALYFALYLPAIHQRICEDPQALKSETSVEPVYMQ